MQTDYTLIYIGAALTTLGTLINFLLDQINRRNDSLKENENRFWDSRKGIYTRVLGLLRALYSEPTNNYSEEHKSWLAHRKESDMALSEAMLFANKELRKKLVKAGNVTYQGSTTAAWEKSYGMEKPAALNDIEVAMKEELGIIKVNNISNISIFKNLWMKLKNFLKIVCSERVEKIPQV